MAEDKRITDLAELVVPVFDDFMHVVDISDITENAAGTSKKSTIGNIVDAVQAVTNPANQIVINSEADFSMQTASEIFLEDDKVYIPGASFVTEKRFTVGKNVVISGRNENILWEYTGILTMFTCLNVETFKMVNISLSAPNSNNMILAFDTPSLSISSIVLENITGIAETPLVKIVSSFFAGVDISNLTVKNINFLDGLGISSEGIIIGGAEINSIIIEQADIQIEDLGKGFCLQTGLVVNDRLQVNGLSFFGESVAAIGIDGDASSANISPNILATFDNCQFNTPNITPLSGILETDIRYKFSNCFPIPDTTISFFSTMTSAETVAIVTIGVFVPVAGGNWTTASVENSKWSVDSDGIATFLSEIPTKVKIEANASLEKIGGGGTELLSMRINIDTGSGFPATPPVRSESTTQSGNTTDVTSNDLITLNENDRVRVEIANLDTTNDIAVSANARFLSITSL